MKLYSRFFLVALYIIPFTAGISVAQRNELNPNIGTTRQDSIPEGVMPLDTPVPMSYVLIDNPEQHFFFVDTFEWEDTRDYPLRYDESHLGNYGSAVRALTPTFTDKIGFSPGWFQYDRYFIDVDSFRYYNQDVPVSQIRYGQAGQEDTYLTLDFGRSFAKGINLSVEYNRINQVGEFGHQRQKNTAFGVGIWYDAPSGNYDAFYHYLSNAVTAEENGGISHPELIGDDRYPDLNVPTNITSGITNHKHRSFLTRQIVHLASDTASLGMDLWAQIRYAAGLFKYVDENATSSSAYYGQQYLVDQRGIRQYTYEAESHWSFGVSLPWRAAHSTINSSLTYRSIALEQEPVKRNIDELFFDVSGEFQWVEPLLLKGKLSLGLGQAEGSFSFRADGKLKTGIIGQVLGYWSIVSRKPYLVETSLYVSQQPVYNVAFDNPFLNEVGIEWQWSKQKFQAGISWSILDNYIYFDSFPFPRQLDVSYSLRRFFMSKEFDFRWIGLKGSVAWQPDPPAELAIPEFLYTASLYGRIPIFNKKVTLMPGADVSYHDGYEGVSYFPVNGSYHLTYGSAIPDYFRLDIGLGLNINFINFFARFEDFVGFFDERVLYEADYYPHYGGYFRLGLAAGFFN